MCVGFCFGFRKGEFLDCHPLSTQLTLVTLMNFGLASFFLFLHLSCISQYAFCQNGVLHTRYSFCLHSFMPRVGFNLQSNQNCTMSNAQITFSSQPFLKHSLTIIHLLINIFVVGQDMFENVMPLQHLCGQGLDSPVADSQKGERCGDSDEQS